MISINDKNLMIASNCDAECYVKSLIARLY